MYEPPRFMDFSTEQLSAAPAGHANPDFVEHATVMPTPNQDSWHGIWAFDPDGSHEEVYGDKAEVIAWARHLSTSIQIWNEELQDLEPLPFPV